MSVEMMPAYPEAVLSLLSGGAGGGIRRNPDTGGWWVMVVREDGCLLHAVSSDGPAELIGAFEDRMAAERALENVAAGRAADDEPDGGPAPPVLYGDDPELRLAHARERAKVMIDTQAELARRKFMTPGAGQAMEYLATEAEAEQALVVPEGTVLPAGTFPFLDAEVTARGGTLREAALRVMAAAGLWRSVGGTIKALRLTGKDAVDAAGTVEGVWAATQITWP